MDLTLSEWKSLKKTRGEHAPTLDITPKMKAWESALAKAEKESSSENVKAAKSALTALLQQISTAVTTLGGKKYAENCKVLRETLANVANSASAKKAKERIEKLEKSVEIETVISLARNEEDALYQRRWIEHQQLLKKPESIDMFEQREKMLKEMKELCDAITSSEDRNVRLQLGGNYIKQKKIVDKLERERADAHKIYKEVLTEGVLNRNNLLTEMTNVKPTLVKVLNQINLLKEPVKNDSEEQAELRRQQIGQLLILARTKAKNVKSKYEPGTTLRANLDFKAANIHADDLRDLVSLTKSLFNLNKELSELINAIEEAAA